LICDAIEMEPATAIAPCTSAGRQFATTVVLLLFLCACHREAPAKTYQMRGDIVSIDASSKIAVIHNEKIEGWMDSMTMEFPVHDASLLNGLKPGDRIVATIHVKDDLAYWIDDVKKQ
jgi:Cu/Ag efflux protein CusF